uniref:Small ribosomal subunit protein uS9c n=1 Tax=Lepocinclis tripteris TaxID=135494 RepID=A0A3G3LL42_9EUGL|nr:ribosomal protein S9 [Lepocinclis tripteris]
MEKKLYKNVGRRKSAIATIRMSVGNGNIVINGKDIQNYFNCNSKVILSPKAPLLISNLDSKFDFDVLVNGGGIMGQVYAIRLALARVLFNLVDQASIDNLKSYGLFNRDSRIKERRKYGLRKARKASQFSKR